MTKVTVFFSNIASIKENGTTIGSWTYNSSQQVQEYKDRESDQKHRYSYDITGRLTEVKVHMQSTPTMQMDSQKLHSSVQENSWIIRTINWGD